MKKFKWKKEFYSTCKKETIPWEDYKNAVRVCRHEMKKAKTSLELNLANGHQVHQEGFPQVYWRQCGCAVE